MNNQELADIFSKIAAYYEMQEVPFKPQAYEKAAAGLEALSEDVKELYQREGAKALEEIPGVGRSIAEHIVEYVKTGRVKTYEEFRRRLPVDIEALTSIEGVGAKTVKELYKGLGIKNIADLEKAATAGKIRELPGFGERTEQNILQGIAFVKRAEGRQLLADVYPFVQEVVQKLKSSGLVEEAVPAGSFRRMKETVGDVDILVITDKPEEASEFFLSAVPHVKVWGRGPTKTSVRTRQGFDVDIRVLPRESYGAALQYFTGSKEHNVKLRTYAAGKGFKVSEYGVFKGKRRVAGETEEEVYRALGMPVVAPELREDAGEIEAALEGKLPTLIPYGSLKGDLQVQTDWTDGAHSMEEMVQWAREEGLEYIAITDHTRDLAMVRGADEKKLERQMEEIDKLQKKYPGFGILKGAEVNIRRDGTLDIADEVLAKLDVVGASVHSDLKMAKKDMTRRILRAMANPFVDILFHPTGRVVQRRDPYEVDIDEVIEAAVQKGVALEANASPRMDLKDAYIRKAVQAGATLVINSDAHSREHFQFLKFGVAQARRGWAEQKNVLNTQNKEKFLASLRRNAKKN